MKSVFIFLFSPLFMFCLAGNSYMSYSQEEFEHLNAFNKPIDLNNIDLALIKAGVFYLTNVYRLNKNKALLSYSEQLSFAAYTHSEQMRTYHFFDHVNKKNRDLSTLEKRAQYAGYINYTALAENIFYGYVDLRNAGSYMDLCAFIVDAFISSKEHKENLLAQDVNDIGCGISFDTQTNYGFWYFYFTQDFGSTLMLD